VSTLTPVTLEQARDAVHAALADIIALVRKADAGRYGLAPGQCDDDVVAAAFAAAAEAVGHFARMIAPGINSPDLEDAASALMGQIRDNRERDEAANAEPDPLAVAIHKRAGAFLD
jgi:hypothetical protein